MLEFPGENRSKGGERSGKNFGSPKQPSPLGEFGERTLKGFGWTIKKGRKVQCCKREECKRGSQKKRKRDG